MKNYILDDLELGSSTTKIKVNSILAIGLLWFIVIASLNYTFELILRDFLLFVNLKPLSIYIIGKLVQILFLMVLAFWSSNKLKGLIISGKRSNRFLINFLICLYVLAQQFPMY